MKKTDSFLNKDFLGFIPKPLSIRDRPELKIFPLNVMFARSFLKEGKTIMATAVYNPDLSTFKKNKDVLSMQYFNNLGPESWLVIYYKQTKKSYSGEKYVNGKLIGSADGREWKMFFFQLTILGLSIGERCEFSGI